MQWFTRSGWWKIEFIIFSLCGFKELVALVSNIKILNSCWIFVEKSWKCPNLATLQPMIFRLVENISLGIFKGFKSWMLQDFRPRDFGPGIHGPPCFGNFSLSWFELVLDFYVLLILDQPVLVRGCLILVISLAYWRQLDRSYPAICKNVDKIFIPSPIQVTIPF